MKRRLPFALLVVCLMALAGPFQSLPSAQTRGPAVPPPIAPATIARNDAGQATIRAVRLDRPLQLDGRLDEEVYARTAPIDGFIQQEPTEGAPATEQTFVWVFYDDRNIYVSARCYDSHPEREVSIMPYPIGVSYDPLEGTATVYFRVTQNETGDGLIDPKHWVFSYRGWATDGKLMDPTADQYSGYTRSF